MKVKDLLKKIEKQEKGKLYKVYVVSQTTQSTRTKVIKFGQVCFKAFVLQNYAKDNTLELEKEIKDLILEKDIAIQVALNGKTWEQEFNVYKIVIARLSKNNKNFSNVIAEKYTASTKPMKIIL